MAQKLRDILETPYLNSKEKEKISMSKLIDNIHGYMFIYDTSNKATFDSMLIIC